MRNISNVSGFDYVKGTVNLGAYFSWLDRGKPHGDDWADWFAAEKDIQGLL